MAMPKLMILSRLLVTVIITLLASTCQGTNLLLSRPQQLLYSGQSLDEGSYSLRMQNSCNLALFDGSKAIWTSNQASSTRGCYAEQRTDGNLVIYARNGATVVWASNTRQPGAARNYALLLQQDRNLAIYGPGLWDARTHKRSHTVVNGTSSMIVGAISGQDAIAVTKGRNVLLSGQKLDVGQSLDEGSYSLRMQNSCNLALFEGSKVVWTSNTGSPNRRCTAQLQTDGNFVIYTSNGAVVWATNRTSRRGNYILALQRDRNIAIYGPGLWSTGTNVRSVGRVVHATVNGTDAAGFIHSRQSVTEIGRQNAAAVGKAAAL